MEGRAPNLYNDLTYDEKLYCQRFGHLMREAMEEKIYLPKRNAINSMVYSISCGVHAVSMTSKFWSMKSISGVSES